MPLRALRPVLVLPLLFLAACRDAKVTTYRIPKEKDPEMAMPPALTDAAPAPAGAPAPNAPFLSGGGAMASAAVPVDNGPGLTWTAPAGWTLGPAAPMRKATYAVPNEGGVGGELSITAFPSDVGGELANVNRWRGQVGLPPVAEGDLAGAVSRLEVNGLRIAVVDFASGKGPASPRMLGAIVPYAGGTWFFKLTGPDALLGQVKPEFEAFLRTLKPATQP